MAVLLRGVRKEYNAPLGTPLTVLSEIDLDVQVGQVYCILGPSGCGKTTLLHCILGRIKVDSGTVLVFGRPPGTSGSGVPGKRLGYMPQEFALFKSLTIGETLTYYGRLLQMSAKQIQLRTAFVIDLLHMPVEARLVKTLSGGEQRRLSFCCTLIHEPELIILDEPTVDVDPVLRKSMWEHFLHMAKKMNCAVIMTTHNIEEANKADMIAFMRQGHILAKATPQSLLQTHQSHTLEGVFLRLCHMDDDIQKSEKQKMISTETIWDEPDAVSDCYTYTNAYSKFLPNASRLRAMFLKDMLMLRRNPSFLLFLLFIPVTGIILCSMVFDEKFAGLHISYVNDDIGSFGKLYLDHLKTNTIKLKMYSTVNAAENSVRKGDSWGTIYIGRNFTESMTLRFKNVISLDDAAINQTEINIRMDMTNLQIWYNLTGEFLRAYQAFSLDVRKEMGLGPRIAQPSIAFAGHIYGSTHISFNDYYAPAIIICMTFFVSCAFTGISFIVENKCGLSIRSWAAGLTEVENALSHIATKLLVMSIQLALVFIDTFCFTSMTCKGPVYLIILLIFLQGLCGMSFGLLVAAICKNLMQAISVLLGAMYSQCLLTGMIWPLEGMPTWLRYISYALPQTYPTEALRSIMSRGWSIEYETVWLSFVITITWIIIHLILSAICLCLRR